MNTCMYTRSHTMSLKIGHNAVPWLVSPELELHVLDFYVLKIICMFLIWNLLNWKCQIVCMVMKHRFVQKKVKKNDEQWIYHVLESSSIMYWHHKSNMLPVDAIKRGWNDRSRVMNYEICLKLHGNFLTCLSDHWKGLKQDSSNLSALVLTNSWTVVTHSLNSLTVA